MRHKNATRTLGRSRRQRAALLRNLAISLISNGRIVTTEAKAKELRPFVEKILTAAKDDSVATRRIVSSRLGNVPTPFIKELFEEVGKKYKDREGGYTRITKMGLTDAGRNQAVIELV